MVSVRIKMGLLDGDGFTIMFATGRVPGSLIHSFAEAAICKGGGIGLTSVYFFDVVRGPGVSGPEEFTSRPSPQPKNNRQYFWARVGGRVWSETIPDLVSHVTLPPTPGLGSENINILLCIFFG
jgi:hypothetical protein